MMNLGRKMHIKFFLVVINVKLLGMNNLPDQCEGVRKI